MRALDLQAAIERGRKLVSVAARPISADWPERCRTHNMSQSRDQGVPLCRGIVLAEREGRLRILLSREGRLWTQRWGCEAEVSTPSETITLGLCYEDIEAAFAEAVARAAQHEAYSLAMRKREAADILKELKE